jgi:S-methylmethionine-dependent homocysteine/selenocysteine methylase
LVGILRASVEKYCGGLGNEAATAGQRPAPQLEVLCYANRDEWDARTRSWIVTEETEAHWMQAMAAAAEAGATVLGGCCRCHPPALASLKRSLLPHG